jgi:hypothetical protein
MFGKHQEIPNGVEAMSPRPLKSLTGRVFYFFLLLASFNLGFVTDHLLTQRRSLSLYSYLEHQPHISQPGAPTAPVVWIAFDPYCDHCRELHAALAPRIAAGELRVQWLPIAFVHTDSVHVAADLLAAVDPSSALDKWFGPPVGISPKVPAGKDVQAFKAAVLDNTARVRELAGGTAAPVIIYARKGQSPVVLVGAPTDAQALIQQIRAGAGV